MSGLTFQIYHAISVCVTGIFARKGTRRMILNALVSVFVVHRFERLCSWADTIFSPSVRLIVGPETVLTDGTHLLVSGF